MHFHIYTSNRINPHNNNQITSIQVCVKFSGSAPALSCVVCISFTVIENFIWRLVISGEGLQNIRLCWTLNSRISLVHVLHVYKVTPVVTRGLGFYGLTRRTVPFIPDLAVSTVTDFHIYVISTSGRRDNYPSRV